MAVLANFFAGHFYPGNQNILGKQVREYLEEPQVVLKHPVALVSPHAGYIYSGETAGYAYKQVVSADYNSVIILGPTHQMYSSSLCLPSEVGLTTPLGYIDFNSSIIKTLIDSGLYNLDSRPFIKEHSLEVQIPFIQTALPQASLVMISVGAAELTHMQKAAEVLSTVLDAKTLLVISTDLSHFHPLEKAKAIDNQTIQSIISLDPDAFASSIQNKQAECCGAYPLLLAMLALKHLPQAKATLLHYDTSATASFDKSRVVGYASLGIEYVEATA